jgi:hypothetical protein
MPPPADIALRGQATGSNKRRNPRRDHAVTRITLGQIGSESFSSFQNDHRHFPPVGLSDRKESTVNVRGGHASLAERSLSLAPGQ